MTEKQQKKFIKECRSWIGTKWLHCVCLKGVAVDCVQFMLTIAQEMSWMPKDFKFDPYPRDWALHQSHSALMDFLNKYCYGIDRCDMVVGDIMVYKYGRCNCHVAYYVGNKIAVHSHIKHGVVEFDINDSRVKEKFSCVMRWKENN